MTNEKDIERNIEMIPMDEPRELKLNWVVKEYIGSEIFRFGSEESLTNLEDIKVGDELRMPTLTGYTKAKVIELNGKKGHAEQENYAFILEFDGDDRHCWVCGGMINKRAIANLSKNVIIGS